MKSIYFYKLSTIFENNKVKLSLSFVCLFILMTALSSHKTEAEPIHKQAKLYSASMKHKATATITYQTIRPFHEKQQLVVNHLDQYVIFSPTVTKPEYHYSYTDEIQAKHFYDVSFFEKAMLFNDKLQTLLK